MNKHYPLSLTIIGLMALLGCSTPLTIPDFQQPTEPIPEVEAKDLAPASPINYTYGHLNGIWEAKQIPAGNVQVKDRMAAIPRPHHFAVEVPVGGTVRGRVLGERKGWFNVRAVNPMGISHGPGLNQNQIRSGEPQATYWNPGYTPSTVYFIVGAGGNSGNSDEAFTLEIIRGRLDPKARQD
jgi:hypothetical protein